MARTGRRRRWAVAVGMVALVACAAAPVQAGPDRDFSGAVRASDPLSLALLRTAVASSPTVAALVDALEPTDVIVVVQVALTPNGLAGDLRLINAAGGARYLLIRVNSWQSPEEQMALLGHELQHANEVAQAVDVQDEAGLARLMARIGRTIGRGQFETDAAVKVTRQVRREVRR